MQTYIYSDDTYRESFTAADIETAVAMQTTALRDAYEASDETYWVHADILDDSEEVLESLKVQIDPSVPACTGGTHEWSDAPILPVRGHGGGVIITEVCLCDGCGVARITDTWAQDRSTGEQGLRAVRFTTNDRDEW